MRYCDECQLPLDECSTSCPAHIERDEQARMQSVQSAFYDQEYELTAEELFALEEK